MKAKELRELIKDVQFTTRNLEDLRGRLKRREVSGDDALDSLTCSIADLYGVFNIIKKLES